MTDYTRSTRLYNEARKYLAGGVSSHFRYGTQPVPLFFASGNGSRITDVDGNVYIDYALGNGPVILGHAPARVLEAVAAALRQGQLFAAQHEHEMALAKALVRVIPCADLVRFSMSGSEVVQAALRLARAYTERPKIVKFEGHYHGWFDNIFVSVHPSLEAAGPRERPRTVPMATGQVPGAFDDVLVLPWNDRDALEVVLERHRGQIAGVIMEPILCNTGVVLPQPGYLEAVRDLCTRDRIVLIFDEIITGFRVGLRGAQGLLGVTPDLAVFAKAMAAGFPLSCIAGRREIMQLLERQSVVHGGTYNSNLPSIIAGLATLAELERDGGQVFSRIEAMGQRLMEGLREISARSRHPLHVQGLGAVFHTTFTRQPITDYRTFCQADIRLQNRFVELLQHAGVRTTTRGAWFLSSVHSSADVEETLDVAQRVLAKLE